MSLFHLLCDMKRFTAIIIAIVHLWSHAQNTAPATLDDLVVTADSQKETSAKATLRPSALEKKHSTNGYALLANMNLPDFNIDVSSQTISTITGRDVKILINGTEAGADELATLAASEITRIDYRRNPGGRYAGCGAVINFITAQYDYGGNVYLSADEGLAREYGQYTGMVNYKRHAVTVSLTANGTWDRSSTLNSAENTFSLNDGTLFQSTLPDGAATHTNSQYINLKFGHAANNHSFDISLGTTRSATPRNTRTDNIEYSGLYNFNSVASRESSERGLSPAMKMHYNLYLPGGNTLMSIVTARYGHTSFRSVYSETSAPKLGNNTKEDNVLASATLGYFKSFDSGMSIGLTADEYYNYYHDIYSGAFTSTQTLTNNHIMAMAHIDHNLPCGLSYNASAGITDLYSNIGHHSDNQLSPMAFYGLTYAINPKHMVSVTGNYVHSIYNPQYKNEAVIPTSFFEATVGNPHLEQLKAFQNMMSYNGHAGHFAFSATYDFLKYFGNTSNRYFAENNIMYHQLVNDGNFHYNKFIFGASASLLGDRLRLKGNAIFSMNRFDSKYRLARSNDLRADFSASYMAGDWQIKGSYALPYSALGIEGTKTRYPAQYGVTLSWRHGDWAAECCVENFLDRRGRTRNVADYGAYRSVSQSLSDKRGRNIGVTVTYMLSYGKKTDSEPPQTETSINSAILRPF